tara:strand:- start:23110 stop:23409 length:300 start_codon:yes stop_codon:yes gene_type:complete
MEDEKEFKSKIVGQVLVSGSGENDFLRQSWIGDNTNNPWLVQDPNIESFRKIMLPQKEPSIAEIMVMIQTLEHKISDLKSMIIKKMDIPPEKIKRRKLL